MRRRLLVLLVSVCVLISVASVFCFLYASGFPPFVACVTVSELSSSPGSWLGVRVRTQGRISGLSFIPEEVPPYSYGLIDPVSGKSVGIVWLNGNLGSVPYDKTVTVVGVMVTGLTGGLWVGRSVYYLKAESVAREKLLVDFHSLNKGPKPDNFCLVNAALLQVSKSFTHNLHYVFYRRQFVWNLDSSSCCCSVQFFRLNNNF